ncbi:MAG: restriction endonuclease subunit S [Lachnoclostridium sp.]|nr:restriction endonuclease subunit S [Lachnoclostridium sp.]
MADTPKIRFKGFTDEWEQRKLGELFEERNEQYPMSKDYPLMAFIANIGVAPKGERYDRSALVNDEKGKKYKRTERGDFIYSSNNLEAGSIGLNDYGNACISPVYSIFKSKNNANSGFLGSVLLRKELINAMIQYRQGVVYGQWKIHENDFLNLEIAVPELCEQKKIGEYFKHLDRLIIFHQRKCEETIKLKKYMLQKMFPQNDKKIPEIRFEGFTDEWEQCRLGELGTIQTCKRVFKEQTSEIGDIPFYKNGTIGLKADAFISRKLFEEYKELYPYPEVGDILISAVGSIGRIAEYTGKDEYFQDSNVVWLKTDDRINKKFLKISYQIIEWLIEGSTVKHLYNDNILKSEITMPCSQKEQERIGDYFETIDHLITLHQHKCKELKEVKKFMLQNMFPQKG